MIEVRQHSARTIQMTWNLLYSRRAVCEWCDAARMRMAGGSGWLARGEICNVHPVERRYPKAHSRVRCVAGYSCRLPLLRLTEQASVAQPTPPQPDVAPMRQALAQPIPAPPSQPLCGPPTQPWYGAPPSMPFAEAQSSTSSGVARFLLGGIPLWIGIVALLSVGAIVLVGLLLRREWATVAVVAAIDAAVGAGLILIAAIVILLVRRAQWLTLSLSALLMLVMGLGSVAALTNQPIYSPVAGAESGEQQAVGGGHHAV